MKGKRILASLLCAVVTTVTVLAGSVMPVKAADQTLLNTYGQTYGHVGTCINYNQLTNSNIMSHLKSQYNSITLENEMKPDYILGGSAKLISVQEAKNLGYYIPSNYTDQYVPKLNFDTVDKVMRICYENGIGMRAHTLVWHSQTPTWFFRYGYSANYGFVNEGVMNARMEFYIKSVMNHVYSSQYGKCVYAWDVVNEYFHAVDSGWEAVYGKCGNKPEFVKRAFQYAYDCLEYYKLTNSVSLFYNDFNTYMEVNDVITMINYINSGKKICNGVGMQSHLGTTFPSVDYYTSALKSFLNAGFEVQITELDVTNSSSSEQATYMYNLMKNVNSLKKNGGKITGVTIWGLSDDVSWISDGKNPLLFSRLGVAKESYYKFIQAYNEAGFVGGTTNNNNNTNNNVSNDNNSYATVENGWYYIKNVNAQKYLQVANNSGNSGNNVEIGSGTGALGQKWYVTNKGNNVITLKNGLGCMLDVTAGKNENCTNIEIWTENGKNPQDFMLKNAGNNQFGIVTSVSNGARGLDVENKETADGSNVQQYDYYGGSNQLWVLEKTDISNNNTNVVMNDGWYYIKNLNAQKYLQVAGNQGANAVNVEIGSGSGVKGQKWYVTNTNDGYVTLKNGQGYMLDIEYGKNEDGTNIQTYSNNGADAQKFKIQALGNNQYAILTKVSSDKKALDVYNFGTSDGANVCQWTYYKNNNQIWYFEACSN